MGARKQVVHGADVLNFKDGVHLILTPDVTFFKGQEYS